MLDVLLDWTVVFFPTVLSVAGVLVSLKAPHSKHHTAWRVSLIVIGVLLSGMTFWQQARSRAAHVQELAALNTRLVEIEKNTKEPPKVSVNVPPAQIVVTNPEDIVAKRMAYDLDLKKRLVRLSREIRKLFDDTVANTPRSNENQQAERYLAEAVRLYNTRFSLRVTKICREAVDAGINSHGIENTPVANIDGIVNVSQELDEMSKQLH